MNSYFDYINPKSIHIIFDKNPKKDNPKGELMERPYKNVILDPRSPFQRSINPERQSPPNLSLASAGEWEKEHPHSLTTNTSKTQFNFDFIIDYRSVPILSYT